MGSVISLDEFRNRKFGNNVTHAHFDFDEEPRLEEEPLPTVGELWMLIDGNLGMVSAVRPGYVMVMPVTEGHDYVPGIALKVPADRTGWDTVLWSHLETGIGNDSLLTCLGTYATIMEVSQIRLAPFGKAVSPFPAGDDSVVEGKIRPVLDSINQLCYRGWDE